MAEEFESVEIEVSEEDILYYIEDEDGNELGFAVMEDGQEVEYYYDAADAERYGAVSNDDDSTDMNDGEGSAAENGETAGTRGAGDAGVLADSKAAVEDDAIEIEVSEEDILYYIEDEDGNELGFAVMEDGEEVEYYYDAANAERYGAVTNDEEPEKPAAEASTEAAEPAAGHDAEPAAEPEEPVKHGYLYKMASIAGHKGNKARKKAEVQLDKFRDKAEVKVDKASAIAKEKAREAKAKAKETKEEYDLGITREDITETTADLNAIAKEGAETAKELKEAYDDIMESFGFLVPKKVRRKLP